MKKSVILGVLILLIFLAGCGKNNIQAAVVGVKETADNTAEVQEDAEKTTIERESEKTAEDMLDELKDSTEVKTETKTGTFYGNIEVTSTGKDALKEKTDALFKREFFNLSVDADRKQGPRYH